MIAWREALLLSALVLVPVAGAFFVWAERRRSRDLARFVEAGLTALVVPDLDSRRRGARAALLLAVLACLVLGLAGPMWGFRWQEVRREGIDLVVALDTSRSMLATDIKPSRLARAKLALRDLLGELAGDRIALVAFAGTAFVQCPLTLDHGVFIQSLDAVDTVEGRQSKHQAIVLITDGEDHEGDVGAAATRAEERGIKVFTVGIGTPDGELIPLESGGYLKDRAGRVVKSRLGEETLQDVAVDTGGVYVRASGPSLGLPDLYRDYVATMEKRELESTIERRWEHRYQWPLALALVLLVLEPWIGERRRRALSAVLAGVVVLGAAPAALAWPGDDPAREGWVLHEAGDFEGATSKYNEALIDDPDSVRLHVNLGAAEYRRDDWEKAARAWEEALAVARDPKRVARAAYNVGNARYREGADVAGPEPQTALDRWAAALVSYRRAMGADPELVDAKYNYELVQKKIEELREQLEQQQNDEEQENQENQEQQEEGDEQEPQRNDQQEGEEQQQEEQQEQAQQQEQQQDSARPGEPQNDASAGAQPEAAERTDEMSPEEAMALLDGQRDEELDPREMQRGQMAGEVPPLRDW
jgi:Ca-activated chloride channel family protein